MSKLPTPEEIQQMRIDTLKSFCPSAIPYVAYADRDGEPVQERLFNWREAFTHVLNMLIHTDQALQSLTPGGTEYVHNPERCVALVKEQQAALHKARCDLMRLGKEHDSRVTGLLAANNRLLLWGRRLLAALRLAIKVAGDAQEEWDKAPSGMRAGKILIALAGGCPRYRQDTDEIQAAARLETSEGIAPWLTVSQAKKDGTFYEGVWRDTRGDLNRDYFRWDDGNDDWMTRSGMLVHEPLFIRELVPLPDGKDGLSHLALHRMPPGEPTAVEYPPPDNDHDRIVRQCARAVEQIYVGESKKANEVKDTITKAVLALLSTAYTAEATP